MRIEKNKHLSHWVVIGEEEPSEKSKEKLGLPEWWKYHISLNLKNGKLKCDCMGYMVARKCKHIEKWYKIILNKYDL
jgi:hypothetical protein